MGWAARARRTQTPEQAQAARDARERREHEIITRERREHEIIEARERARHQRTLARLHQIALAIPSRRDFEDMVLQAPHPEQFRALVEPMLPAGLRCCVHAWNAPHQSRCPLMAKLEAERPVIYGAYGQPVGGPPERDAPKVVLADG